MLHIPTNYLVKQSWILCNQLKTFLAEKHGEALQYCHVLIYVFVMSSLSHLSLHVSFSNWEMLCRANILSWIVHDNSFLVMYPHCHVISTHKKFLALTHFNCNTTSWILRINLFLDIALLFPINIYLKFKFP